MNAKPKVSWSEPFAYVRAKRRQGSELSLKGNFLLFLFYVALLGIMVFSIGNHAAVQKNILITIIGAFVLAYPMMWCFSYLPQSVFINSNGIGSGTLVYTFEEIAYSVVGTTEIESKVYGVFMFVTKSNIRYTYGLANKIVPSELVKLLKHYEVKVE